MSAYLTPITGRVYVLVSNNGVQPLSAIIDLMLKNTSTLKCLKTLMFTSI